FYSEVTAAPKTYSCTDPCEESMLAEARKEILGGAGALRVRAPSEDRQTLSWCYNFGIVRKLSAFGAALIAVFFAFAFPGVSATNIAGLWDAEIVADQLQIPFRFEIDQTGNQVEGFFFEGDRKIGSSSGSFAGDHLRLQYDYLDTTLEIIFQGDQFL